MRETMSNFPERVESWLDSNDISNHPIYKRLFTSNKWFLLHGAVGTGKTTVACAYCRHQTTPPHFIRANELISYKYKTATDKLEGLLDSEFVYTGNILIDDITEREIEVLNAIVLKYYEYTNSKLILTTNMSAIDLLSKLEARASDRARVMFDLFEFKGGSLR